MFGWCNPIGRWVLPLKPDDCRKFGAHLLRVRTLRVAAQVYYGIGGSLEVEVIGSGRKTLSPLRKIKPAFPRHRSCLLDTIQQTR